MFVTANSLVNSPNYNPEVSTYSQVVDSSETLVNVQSTYLASQFGHYQQNAKWFLDGVDESFRLQLNADDYLLTIPIVVAWFIVTFTSKYRLSGWKDASLLYKIKNALI